MGHAASIRLPLTLASIDEGQARREREENHRILADARAAQLRVDDLYAKLRRMSDLYRERLEGRRP